MKYYSFGNYHNMDWLEQKIPLEGDLSELIQHEYDHLAFTIKGSTVSISWITNQSTGYCPEPESWPALEIALNRAGFFYPDRFDTEFIFRYCFGCNSINVVKDGCYYCSICEAELDEKWNLNTFGLYSSSTA